MPLSPEQARIADEALERVRAAERAAAAAVDSRSSVLTWITGSSSSASAEDESLRQTRKIRADLEARRPGLEPEGLASFVQLAAAGAQVGDLLASARLATAGGFVDEVVTPTARALDPTNLSGPVGKVALGALVLVVLVVALRVSR